MVKIKKENETKAEKFIRMAENRTKRILEDLRILGNCSNSKYYGYTIDDVDLIFNEIEKKIKDIKNLFLTELYKLKKKPEKFTLRR